MVPVSVLVETKSNKNKEKRMQDSYRALDGERSILRCCGGTWYTSDDESNPLKRNTSYIHKEYLHVQGCI